MKNTVFLGLCACVCMGNVCVLCGMWCVCVCVMFIYVYACLCVVCNKCACEKENKGFCRTPMAKLAAALHVFTVQLTVQSQMFKNSLITYILSL